MRELFSLSGKGGAENIRKKEIKGGESPASSATHVVLVAVLLLQRNTLQKRLQEGRILLKSQFSTAIMAEKTPQQEHEAAGPSSQEAEG